MCENHFSHCEQCGSPAVKGRAYGCLYALNECGLDAEGCPCMGSHKAIVPTQKCAVVRSERAKARLGEEDV